MNRPLALREEGGAQVGDVEVGGEPGALQVAERGAPYGGRGGAGSVQDIGGGGE